MQTLRRLPVFAAIAAAALFSGCAVISEDQCRAGNWYEQGVAGGQRGVAQSTVYEIAQACQAHGVRVDSDAWLRGHEEGVEEYCTPENGFREGRRGRDYAGVCTGPNADQFMTEYRRGLQLYRVEQQYQQLAYRYDRLQDELFAVRAALHSAESEEEARVLNLRRRSLVRELRILDLELHRFGAPRVNFWH